MNIFKTKIAMFAIVFLMLFYFTNDFSLIDIEKTAIVVALGIDSEDNEYTVTAQIAVPSSTAEKTVKNQDKSVESKGKTVGEAIDRIGEITGWYPMLSFCELIVFGKNILNGDVMDTLSYFIRSDKVPDSAILATCEDKASDILKSKAPLDDMSAFALEKIISRESKSMETISVTNIKDFAQSYYSKSGSSFMPMIKIINDKSGNNSGEANTESGNNSDQTASESGDSADKTSSANGNASKENIYDTTITCIFSKGKLCDYLTNEETMAFNLINKNKAKTLYTVSGVKMEDKTSDVTLKMQKINVTKKLSFDEGPVYNLNVDITFRIEDADASLDKCQLTHMQPIPQNILDAAEEEIAATIQSLYDKCASSDCDLLKIKENLYKYHYDEYEIYKDFPLNKITLKSNVTCHSSVKNNAA